MLQQQAHQPAARPPLLQQPALLPHWLLGCRWLRELHLLL
jgi:hypothetical protein